MEERGTCVRIQKNIQDKHLQSQIYSIMVSVCVCVLNYRIMPSVSMHTFFYVQVCACTRGNRKLCGGHRPVESSGSAGQDMRRGPQSRETALCGLDPAIRACRALFVRLCFWLETWVPAPARSAPAWVTVRAGQARGHRVPHLPQRDPAGEPESCCSASPGYGSCQGHRSARSRR